jgi:alpha-tubulin suppressor-like RCC1 family protein
MECWGDNSAGELGIITTTCDGEAGAYGCSSVPVPVPIGPVTAIAAGIDFTCAVVNGDVECWGDNYLGALGNNSTTDCNPGGIGPSPCSPVPTQVAGTANVTAIAASGNYFACALGSGGILCWGNNTQGQLGYGNTTASMSSLPQQVSGL